MIYNYCVLKRIVNRGYLIGPICPIYGCGFVLAIILIGNSTSNYIEIYLKCFLICAVIEYVTSYIMEKLFRARWWNYSRHKFNLNGRICLETLIPFGILGTLFICFIHPSVMSFVKSFDYNIRFIISIIIFIIFVIDNIFSCFFMNKIKKQIKNANVDNTELIRIKTIEWIEKNSLYYKRIRNAFPRFIINPAKPKKKK